MDRTPTPSSVAPSFGGRLARASARLVAGSIVLVLGGCAAQTPRDVSDTSGEPAPAAALPSDRSAGRASGPTVGVPESADAPTLYADLGGRDGVAALSERFIREIAADERIRGHYRDTDIGRFNRMMQLQMCERTGGGCTYTGDDMRRTHGGMNITPTEFNAIVEALMRAMDARDLPMTTQNRLLALYAPMREDIIDR